MALLEPGPLEAGLHAAKNIAGARRYLKEPRNTLWVVARAAQSDARRRLMLAVP